MVLYYPGRAPFSTTAPTPTKPTILMRGLMGCSHAAPQSLIPNCGAFGDQNWSKLKSLGGGGWGGGGIAGTRGGLRPKVPQGNGRRNGHRTPRPPKWRETGFKKEPTRSQTVLKKQGQEKILLSESRLQQKVHCISQWFASGTFFDWWNTAF